MDNDLLTTIDNYKKQRIDWKDSSSGQNYFDVHYNTYFYIHSIRGDNTINISDISFAIQKDAYTILTSARVYINDTDGVDTFSRWENGILSESDRIEITSMTEKYRGSAVRMIINDFQVGYGKIYNFNLEGDTEGGIKSNSD